jgi:hypothetical protein
MNRPTRLKRRNCLNSGRHRPPPGGEHIRAGPPTQRRNLRGALGATAIGGCDATEHDKTEPLPAGDADVLHVLLSDLPFSQLWFQRAPQANRR